MYSRLRSLAVLVLVLAAPVAGAQSINRSATGLASATQTITFEGQSGAIGSQYAAQGVTFGSGAFFDGSSYFSGSGGAQTAANNFGNGVVNPIDIFFTNAIQGVAFQFITNPGTTTFTALLGGSTVSTFSASTDVNGWIGNATEFYGFDNTVVLDQIQINVGNDDGALVLDNLQTGVVATPEPASMTLVATGLIGMFGVARRRRNRSVV